MSNKNYKLFPTINLIVIIVIIAIMFILVVKNAKSQERVGYLITIETLKPPKFEKFEVLELNVVDSILTEHMGHEINVSVLLQDSPFYTAGKLNHYYYIEKKEVIEKKNGKLKFKKIKNKGVNSKRSPNI